MDNAQRFRFPPGLARVLVWTLGLTALAGCSSQSGPLAEVEGTVTLQGQVVPNVRVEFVPDARNGFRGPRSTGVTDDKGHYVLTCDDGRPGAVVGKHLVSVVFDEGSELRDEDPRNPNPRPNTQTPRPNPNIPPRYTAAASTPLKPEVKPGKQTIDLPLVRD